MSRNSLLFISHYPFYGGPQNRIAQLAEPLRRHSWDTTVALPQEPGNAYERLTDAGVDVVQLKIHRLRSARNVGKNVLFAASIFQDISVLRQLIRERNVSLVVVAGLVNPQGSIAAKLEKRAVVWQVVDTRTPAIIRAAITPIVTRTADVVMTTGEKVASSHPGLEILGDRLIPFYSPVDTVRFAPNEQTRQDARKLLHIPPGGLVIGAVANITPQKGIEYLLRTYAELRKQRDDVYLRIIGSRMGTQDRYWNKLSEEASKLGLKDWTNSIVYEPRGDVSRVILGIDIFVLTSVPNSEGAPTSVIEAMACGIPVVAADVGSVSELVSEGRTGYVVGAGEIYAFTNRIQRLLNDPDRRRDFGAEARRIATKEFALEKCLSTHLSAFDAALRHNKP